MSKDPAFLFYSSDFLSGITDLTMEERGQYITLLCVQHQKGFLTEKTIRLLVGSVSVDVLDKFSKDENGNYFNIRLKEEAEKRNKFTESRRNNGSNGGRPLKGSIKIPNKDSQWKEMLKFFNNSCIDCGCNFISPDKPTKDHIIATLIGGEDNISNWQPLCRECNASKCADHSTDFRLKYINEIPDKYKTIWFSKNNHMENENEDVNIVNNNIPDFDVFLEFALSNKPLIDNFHLKAKYDSWIENNWKDGNDRKIKNWKTKLKNTLPYLKENNNKKQTNEQLNKITTTIRNSRPNA